MDLASRKTGLVSCDEAPPDVWCMGDGEEAEGAEAVSKAAAALAVGEDADAVEEEGYVLSRCFRLSLR